MAKCKVTVRFKILELLDGFVDNATAKDIGQTIVDSAKEMVASGQSPVAGYGRFEEYKAAQHAGMVKAFAKGESKENAKAIRRQAKQVLQSGYPMNVMKKYPDKKVRPVNLFLSGKMMDECFDFRISSKPDTVEVGFINNVGNRTEIAQYHNEGTDKMAQRKVVPGQNETWAVSIMRDIADTYGKRLAKLIRQSNEKE